MEFVKNDGSYAFQQRVALQMPQQNTLRRDNQPSVPSHLVIEPDTIARVMPHRRPMFPR